MRRTLSAAIALSMLGLAAPAAVAGIPPSDPVISEIRIDQPSTDLDEYVELAAEPGTPLEGLTYLVIGDGRGGSGVIENVTVLTGEVPASGFFVVAESTFTLGTADQTAGLNFENSDNVTHLLVRGFTGSDGDDLDGDDDGSLDSTPWSSVADAISLVESPGAGDAFYATATVGPDGPYVPGHVFRCAGWEIGSFGIGEDTPGSTNCSTPAAPSRGGVVTAGGPGVPLRECGWPATLISAVQGPGDEAAVEGDVQVEAVVTGVFPDLDAFTLQEEDGDADGDAMTSEGIHVYAPGIDDVAPGDLVRVKGTAGEFFGKTQLRLVDHRVCDEGLSVTPATLDLPLAPSDREPLEGMLVTVVDTVHVTNLFTAARYGEIVLAEGGMLRTGTDVAAPGPDALEVEAMNAARSIQIDDADGTQNPLPNPWFKDETSADPADTTDDTDPVIRAGDSVSGLTGVLDYAFGTYEILPTEPVTFVSENPRTDAPSHVDGSLQVASFNVLNYFTTLDRGQDICGPTADQGCRGANTERELADQRAKIVTALAALDADIVGLIEIENDAADAAVADLVAGLNDLVGADTYRYVRTGAIGTDVIRVALIYRRAAVTPVGPHAILDSSVDPRFNDEKNRPVLAQTFRTGTGEFVTVAVNHLKSKGSSCASLGDPNTGDGQGNCNLTRTAAAQAEVDWLASMPTGPQGGRVLVVGDLNAYAMEDPVQAFVDAGYVDVIERFASDGDDHSYVFDGRFGRLDHALASPSLVDAVRGATVWHVNSEEVNALTYDTRFEPFIAPGAYASSDHDPVLVGLDIRQPRKR